MVASLRYTSIVIMFLIVRLNLIMITIISNMTMDEYIKIYVISCSDILFAKALVVMLFGRIRYRYYMVLQFKLGLGA